MLTQRDRTPPAAKPEAAPAAPAKPAPKVKPAPGTKLAPAPKIHPPAVPSDQPKARLALVIDDLGRSLSDQGELEKLRIPLAYAVLPFETRTPQVVAALAAARAEILCHLPMAADGPENPGPGALSPGMSAEELRRATEAALDAVPAAVGVNNHMGSKLTADPQAMRAILSVLKRRELFFLDSRTSNASVGYQSARELGLPAAERQVFLDRDQSEVAIEAQFERWLEVARERGAAIAIGHPHPETFRALARLVPKARERGFEFVPLSYLLDRGATPEM